MLKTKIICTLGPSTDDESVLRELMRGGMSVARMNFSHGSHIEHKKRLDLFKRIREELAIPIAVMLDTKGPEIRIRRFADERVELVAGQRFILTTREVEGNSGIVSVTYDNLARDIAPGCRVLIDDGMVELRVDEISGTDVICVVLNGGTISNNKSINIPDVHIALPYMSDKDREDILFAVENDMDFIAASFVRNAADVLEITKILRENNAEHIQIIAKIENQQGVDNIDDILRVCSGIMVARGDMGVEISFENLPSIQKSLIKKCFAEGKRVITATQMLDSMIRNPRPTRAETTDVANAIYDGTSAIMLSGETAAGRYPVESLSAMVRIAAKTEESIHYTKRFVHHTVDENATVSDAICHAACTTAHDLGATAIIAVTSSGHTARTVAGFRPACPIIAPTVSARAWRQLALSWGVYPVMAEDKKSSDNLFDYVVDLALQQGLVSKGDLVVITAGIPFGIGGKTNVLKAHLVGDEV